MRKVYGLDIKYLFLFGLMCVSILYAEAANASSSSGMTITKAEGALTQMGDFMKGQVWTKGALAAVVTGLVGSLFAQNMKAFLKICGLGIAGGIIIAFF